MLGTVIAAAAPSKVPFYIAGGVLVIWAIVLAGLGLSKPSFPFNARGERGVISVSFVLVIVTLAMAIITE